MNAPIPAYGVLVRIGWRLLWPIAGSFLVLMMMANVGLVWLLPELTRTGPSVAAFVLPLAIVTLLTVFVVMPLILRTILSIPIGGYRVVVIEEPTTALPHAVRGPE